MSPGFHAENILTGQISLPGALSRTAPPASPSPTAHEALGHQPGVVAAGVVTNVPLSGIATRAPQVKGQRFGRANRCAGIYSYSVAGDYFARSASRCSKDDS